jgi:hypothetical protein
MRDPEACDRRIRNRLRVIKAQMTRDGECLTLPVRFAHQEPGYDACRAGSLICRSE